MPSMFMRSPWGAGAGAGGWQRLAWAVVGVVQAVAAAYGVAALTVMSRGRGALAALPSSIFSLLMRADM